MYSNQETKGQVTVENTLTVPSCGAKVGLSEATRSIRDRG